VGPVRCSPRIRSPEMRMNSPSALPPCFPVIEPVWARQLNLLISLERARGFEPPTPTLARLCSTPELHPRPPRRGLPRKIALMISGKEGLASLAFPEVGSHRPPRCRPYG